jgi:hypothetical protein
MRDLRTNKMHLEKQRQAVLAIILILVTSFAAGAQQAASPDKVASGTEPPPSRSPSNLLPDKLGGIKAATEIKHLTRETLADLVGDKASVYQEYRVTSAASREYSGVRVDVFETQNQFAALGLFMFNSGASRAKPIEEEEEVGSNGARIGGAVIFWKCNFFVRVGDANQKPSRGSSAVREGLARALAGAICSKPVVNRPSLLDSLPTTSLVPQSQQYFLGPDSLNTFIPHGRAMFEFVGDTEAVVGEYTKAEVENARASQGQPSAQSKGGGSAGSVASQPGSPTKLVIVECHTPEFATDEMARVSGYISSLPEIEQQQIIFKRTGNYIVAAVNVGDRDFAEGLVNSVQYPYTVKWLRNPLWPTNDPFRVQKAADMLLSTFGLLGLILLTVLMGGTVFGTTVFLKRRKQQREVFSDAGGMLRLDIEPFVLALPPKRDK